MLFKMVRRTHLLSDPVFSILFGSRKEGILSCASRDFETIVMSYYLSSPFSLSISSKSKSMNNFLSEDEERFYGNSF